MFLLRKCKQKQSGAFEFAKQGRIPARQRQDKPELQNRHGQTVAMILSQQGIIPPKEWEHNPEIKDKENHTTCYYLWVNGIMVPDNLQDEQYKNPKRNYKFEYKDHIYYNTTDAIQSAIRGYIPYTYTYHNPNIIDRDGHTVEYYLQQHNIDIPLQWKCQQDIKETQYNKNYYNPEKDENSRTQAIKLAKQGIIPDKQYQHDPEIKDKDGNTVCYYLWDNGIFVPENWQDEQYKNPERAKGDRPDRTLAMQQILDDKKIPDKKYYHDPRLGNKYRTTVAMILAIEGIIPPEEWKHKSNLQNKNGWTVAMMLANNGIIPPKQWEHKPDLQEKSGDTVARLLASKGIIPPSQWNHDPTIKGYNGFTVAITLAFKSVIPPSQWYHDPNITNRDKFTVAIYLAYNGIVPPQEWQHKPELQNNYGYTVAMELADKGILPPQYWNHKSELQNKYKETVAILLANNKIIPSLQWIHKSDIQDNNGFTVAISLAYDGIIPPQQWQHKPEIKTTGGWTVAMQLAFNKIIPPKQWFHDPNIKNKYKNTVAYYLKDNKLPIPNEWYDKEMKDEPKQPEFIQQAIYGQIPNKPYNIDPEYDCGFGWTVAMLLAYNGKDIPEEWQYNQLLTDNDGLNISIYYALGGHNIPDKWKHDKLLRNKYGQTIAMCYALNGHIPPQEWEHDPQLYDTDGYTVAMDLALNKIISPKQWIHDKLICNYKGKTVQYLLHQNDIKIPEEWSYGNEQGQTDAMIQAINGQIPNEENYHDSQLKDYSNKTVCYYLKEKQLPVPNEWYDESMKDKQKNPNFIQQAIYGVIPEKPDNINSYYQNCDGWTVAMILARLSKNIPKQWCHDKYLTDNKGKTVQHYLEQNNIQVPKEWSLCIEGHENEPDYKNENGQTNAMFLAQKGIFPNKKMQHDVELRDNDGNTVCYYLFNNGVQVPECWQDEQYNNPQRFDFEYNNRHFNLNYHNITDAMKDAIQGKVPDKRYYHNPNIKDLNNNTVCYYLWNIEVQIPKEWQDNQYKNPPKTKERSDFTEAMHQAYDEKKVPDKKYYHNPSITNDNGWTVAMDLAYNGIIPPKQWQHDSQLQNNNGDTVALLLANKGIIPPKQWEHKPDLQDKDGDTVARKLAIKGIIPPSQWEHDPCIKGYNGNTVAMSLAWKCIILPQQWYHNPNIQDKYGNTVDYFLLLNRKEVPQQWRIKDDYNNPLINKDNRTKAMIMSKQGKIPYKEYEHKPELQDRNGYTVAMYLAEKELDIPEQWRHDKLYKNKYGQTVAIIQSSKGVVPDEYWMHDVDIQDYKNNTIKSNLLKYNYIYKNNQFIFNVQIELKQETCCICLEDEKQEFVKSICRHNVCLECFKELVKNKRQNNCPNCKIKNWFTSIDEYQYQKYLTVYQYQIYE